MTAIGYIILPLVFISVYFIIEKGIKLNLAKFLGYSFVLSLTVQLFFNKIIPSLTVIAGTTVLLMLIIICAMKLMMNPSILSRNKYLIYIIAFFILISFYFLFSSLASPASLFSYIYEFRVLFIVYLYTAIIFAFSKREILNDAFLFKVLVWMFVFQVGIGVLQYSSLDISNLFKFNQWVHNGEIQGRIEDQANVKVLIGTFGHMHSYSAYLVMMTLFFVGSIKCKIIKGSWNYYLLICTSIIIILLTGIRTPVLSLIVGILMFYYLIEKKKFFLILIILVLVVPFVADLIVSSMGTSQLSSANDFDNPLLRVGSLFTSISGGARSEDYVFVTRGKDKINLILNAFIQSPLFGASKGYLLGHEFDSPTDYYLFLTVIEFGIIGFLLLLAPFLYVFQKLKQNKKIFPIVFSVFTSLIVSTLAHHTINNMPHIITFATIVAFLISKLNLKTYHFYDSSH
ncbi:oligosaccharide repeat unit polymerase [Rhodohalobacter mucosus]|uniref:O-antigen ligase n=1 Tax=Rhodohalobacter mucosus TaxID=2079485 RepID=A0A316TXR8_9BACT|nr:oligosaccharide repeat unit polymerase [Rhodohalobacter mucosus]PWN07464.1 hypothetical protein DDZ15_04160 [Rhodohalobacter mucosus]